MSGLETPGNGKSAFERRSEKAMARRKMPAESDEVIQLPDLSTPEEPSSASPGTPVQADRPWPLVAPKASPPLRGWAMPDYISRPEGAAILRGPNAPQDAPTLDVILQDPKNQELMGEFLRLRGRGDLIVKFSQEPLKMSAADKESLRALRVEFGDRLALANESQSYLKQEDVAAMLKNPAFDLFADSLSPERALQVIKDRGIPLLFIRESWETISQMILAQRALQGIRSGPKNKYYVALRERVLKRAGSEVRPEHLDPNVMLHVMHKSMGELLTGQGPGGREADMLNAINHNISSVSDVLAASVSSDPELVLDAAREALTGKHMPHLGQRGEAGHEAMKKKEGTYAQAEMEKEFKKFDARLREKGVDTAHLSAADHDKYWNNFVGESQESHGRDGRGHGWFSRLLDWMFSANLNAHRSQFKFGA